ncbi:hypothetical protein A7981_00805 [Methylovorus sp. MM2]|uniref:DUF748 domain-containing protein n=1 Tax=Methylovorus sp. MM2 TaxID=1848038 RepID=UPI0007DF09C5|nr:DUF748 domain-containing protein [Methylovorus sp. MM2]OAM52064.1 hypothetical protein A7981_00805 [Methylovorus sp. MM2]
MRNKIIKILVSLPFMIVAGLFAAYLLFGYFAVDPLAKRILPWVAENKLASKATVEKVSFDPFGLTVTVDNLRLTQLDGGELAGFDRLFVNLEVSGIFRFAWRLKDIQLTAPKAKVEVAPDGKLNWAQLIAKLNEDKTEDDSKGMPRLLIDHLLIEKGDIRYIDRSRPTPLKVALEPFGLQLDTLSTLPEDLGDYSFVANLPEQGGTLKWKGEVGLNPITSKGTVELQGLKLVKLLQLAEQPSLPVNVENGKINTSFAYDFAMQEEKPKATLNNIAFELNDFSGFLAGANEAKDSAVKTSEAKSTEAKTTVALKALTVRLPQLDFSMQPTPQVKFSGLDIVLKNASLKYGASPLLVIPKAAVNDVALNLAEHDVKVADLVLSGAAIQAVRDKTGNTEWQKMLASLHNVKPVSDTPPATVDAEGLTEPAEKTEPIEPWKVALSRFAIEGTSIHIEDQAVPTPVALDIQDAMIEVRDASMDMKQALPVKAAFKIKQGGQFDADGNISPSPLKGDLNLKLAGLSLKPFAPYVNQAAMLKLNDGAVNASGKLAIKSDKTLSALFKGGFSVNQLAINEEYGGALFLGWKSLASESLEVGIAPNRLSMSELRIIKPVGKFIIHEDKTLNVTRIMRKPAEGSGTPPPAKVEANKEDVFPITVDRVRIDNANLDFADLSLTPQFGTHINTLSGVINGLSTNPKTTAQVELDGKVDDYGSARIRGSVQPFHATDFTDLKVVFRNLDMSRLTPYSGKFAGRRIDSGKLSVDLEYKIKHRQLAGENQVTINKLRLGERVESPDAMSLPLDLAIALLEDSDGIIDLNLPVSGNLDDPQFSYGKIVWKALVNVLTKIVTSPFRALGNLLGIESDKLAVIMFDPGSSDLAPPEQEKLKMIAQAMIKRPALTLSIGPVYDTVADTHAIQELTIRRDLAKQMGLKVENGQQAGPIDLTNRKTQAAVEALHKARIQNAQSKKMLDKLSDIFTKPKEPQPTSEQLLAQLISSVPVAESDLVNLAKARANAIQQALINTEGLPATSLSITEPTKHTGAKDSVDVKMELGAKALSATTPPN